MALANSLHHGRLRQYSGQYGGWLSIKVVLFHRALVMDPDADAPNAAVTPRKRRNSVKARWMELFAVESIVEVRKEDKPWTMEDDSPSAALSPPAAARRSRRSSAAEFISMGFGFTVTTANPEQTFQFEAATEGEREEWVRCLLLAKKLLAAELSSSSLKEPIADQDAFFRFAASDSEDESSSDSASDNDSDSEDEHGGAENHGAAANGRGVSSIRSAQPLPNPHHTPIVKPGKNKAISLTILHVTATDASSGTRIEVTVPLSESSQQEISVKQVKLDAIQQLRSQLYSTHNTSSRLFRDLLRREADFFVLCNEERDQWFKDEQCPIGFYLHDAAHTATSPSPTKRTLFVALQPVNTMPHPMIEVEISTTKNKVSDLSQRTYTAYQIDVAFNDMKWQLTRRYKEFDALQRHLKHKYAPVPLPKLPSKHLFTPKEGDFVDKRREQLGNYLKQMILHPLVSSDVLFLSFLGVVSTSRDPELSNHDKKNVFHITTLHQSLDVGDILLFSCRFGASVLQRTFTGAKYDHVGIVVPGASRNLLRIMEATSEGIQVYSLKARLMAYAREVSNAIVVRKIRAERTPEVVEQLRLFVERVEGNPYSILGILRSQGESARVLDNKASKVESAVLSASSGNSSSGSDDSDPDSQTSTPISPSQQPKSETSSEPESEKKRKYFCSSLAASTLKHLGWIHTSRSSSHFWPGSFEDGGEIEQCFVDGVAMEPEAVIDCRIVEVGLATQEAKPTTV